LDGRLLLKESDLTPKNEISINPLVPRSLEKQIDLKIGSWKTSYDVLNDAPSKPDPLSKKIKFSPCF
jgi:hypothetical protein